MLRLDDAANRTRGLMRLGLTAVLVIALVGCTAAPAPTPTAAPALPATATATAGPTDTPAPTATSTATATPTRAPSPTATLAPTPTPAAQAEASRYVREMEAIAAEWEAFRTSADALITEVGQNFFAICFTRSGEIDQHIVTGRELLGKAEAVEPPDEVAEQHNRLLEEGRAGLNALEQGKAALCQRLDTGLALQQVEEANQHLEAAYAAAQELFDWVAAEGLVQ